MVEVVIIGGGPAGIMAARELQHQHVPYVLIDKNPLLGKKLLITGGSRCNVTNNRTTKEFINDLTIKHKKFLYSSLSSFGPEDVIKLMEKEDVPLLLENDFKYFPKSGRSIDVLKAISNSLDSKNVMLNTKVIDISYQNEFKIKTNKSTIRCNKVIVATGSKSFPKTGSTGDGIEFAKKLGHETLPFYPAETNVYSTMIASRKEDLQGVSFTNSTVRIKGTKTYYKGALMFTHFGLSGPVIQHLSEELYFSLIKGKTVVEVSLTNYLENELIELFEDDSNKDVFIHKILQRITIKRVAKYLMDVLNQSNKKLAEISKRDKTKIINALVRYEIPIDKVESMEKAYVNGGGVSTKDLSPKSFESKKVKNLYFVGETVDIHGPIGGYNITMALSSGLSAAKDIISKYHENN